MSGNPVCSIIVPSYRAAETIGDCLTALLSQDLSLPYEVIVVDSSPDETPALVRSNFPQVQLIHLPQQTGPELARNIGAKQARGEILAFIDSDCVAPPDWLRRLYMVLQQGYEVVGGATANGNGDSLVSWAGYVCEFREFLPGKAPRDAGYLSPNNAAYRATTFWAAGGFPPGYYPMEDQVFHAPLRRQGVPVRFDPRIVVAHMHRTEYHAFLQHQRRLGRANARVLHKLGLRGAGLVRRPWLMLLAMPALIPFRFVRTIHGCLSVERGLVLRRPALTWLCWLGMCWWGLGFMEGARERDLEPVACGEGRGYVYSRR